MVRPGQVGARRALTGLGRVAGCVARTSAVRPAYSWWLGSSKAPRLPSRRRAARCSAPPPPASPRVAPAAVQAPKFVRQIDTGETGWFSSPGLVDLDGDGRLEIVAPFYSTFVFDAKGHQLGRGTASEGRVYAPSVVTDLEGDGVTDIVVGGNAGTVAAYEFRGGRLQLQGRLAGVHRQRRPVAGGPRARRRRPERRRHGSRWWRRRPTPRPRARRSSSSTRAATCSSQGRSPPRLASLQPAAGPGNDLRFNGVGNHGYGAYGENVAHRQHRRRPRAGDHHHLRQPPDQRLQPRRHLDPRLALVHEPGVRRRGPADGLGAVHPVGRSQGRAAPLPPAHRARGRARPARPGCSGPPRRPRWPTWTATAATR